MATVTKVSARFGFKDSLGGSISKTFGNIDPSVANADLQALSAACVANKEVFAVEPAVASSIQKISTTTEDVPLS